MCTQVYIKNQIKYYKKLYSNTKTLQKLPTRWLSHLKYTLMDNMFNLPSMLGIFIASIQYCTWGKMVNILVSLLNIALCFLMTEIAMINDRKIIHQGESAYYDIRLDDVIFTHISMNNLKIGMIIILKPHQFVPVPRASLQSKTALFNVQANNGEQNTYCEYHQDNILTSDLINIGEQDCDIKILQCHESSNEKVNQSLNAFNMNIITTQTYVSFFMCILTFCIIQGAKWQLNVFVSFQGIVDLSLELLSNLILFNYLIPQMKTLPVAVIRMLVMLIYSNNLGVKEVNSDEIEQQSFLDLESTNKQIILVSDKTGTLTKNELSIEQHMIHDSSRINLLLSINSGFQLPSNREIYANCPEEREIARLYRDEYKITLKPFNGDDPKGNYTSSEFNALHYGRHSYHVDFQGPKYYHVIQFQSEQLANICYQDWKPKSAKRSLMVCYRQVKDGNFEASLAFYIHCIKTGLFMQDLHILAEFYFSDPLREGSLQGFQKLQEKENVSFVMCTGDSLTTAAFIGEQLGMKNVQLYDKIQDVDTFTMSKNSIAAKISSSDKALLIKKLKKDHPQSIILMFGDQKNDESAIKEASFSFVQSEGCLECQIAAKCKVKDLMGVYQYLYHIRRLRIYGQYWILNQFHLFNCTLSAMSLVAVCHLQFNKRGVLYIDPWEPKLTIALTNIMAFVLIALSFQPKLNHSEITNYSNMVGFKNIMSSTLKTFSLTIVLAFLLNWFETQTQFANLFMVFILSILNVN